MAAIFMHDAFEKKKLAVDAASIYKIFTNKLKEQSESGNGVNIH